jgi:8-oxo-dGTP pyrophosphatase MutT (NUDIX family)
MLFIPRFLDLLEHPRAYHRDHLPGHMTGSTWIVNLEKNRVLLTHHAKLNRWLQPGGHADGDEDIFQVALKEAEEETGLQNLIRGGSDIFDIDIHLIPERKGFPAHDHYDIRFLFFADAEETLLLSEESHALAWVPLTELVDATEGNDSILRMAAKTRTLL